MPDHQFSLSNISRIDNLTPELINFLTVTMYELNGSERRKFMARVVSLFGKGGQSLAERELGWDRKTIIKGMKELQSGFDCVDNFSGRGRNSIEVKLPNLLDDIKDIVNPVSQCDPTFHTTGLYSPLTANEVYRRLIEDKNYNPEELPTVRTICTKLNQQGFRLKKVTKCKPKKKIPETDKIFDHVHRANRLADETEGVIRISIDTKAAINIGPFSRGGYSRHGVKGSDHDFAPESVLKLFGISIPKIHDIYYFLTDSNVTADFMIDSLEDIWPSLKARFNPHTIAINADNGPENSSRRTQFIHRLVEFAKKHEVGICLIYYPPYHSKYNPIERTWGVLEKHWNGQLLDSVEKVVGLAKTMKYKGKNPVVKFIKKTYEKGVNLGKKAMQELEKMIERVPGIEKWAVDIPL